MYLCIDVGNSQIYGAFYKDGDFKKHFRFNTKSGWSSDQLGIFLRSFCREEHIEASEIEKISISSVVPSLDHHLKNACLKYFDRNPLFVKPGVKTGLGVNKYAASREIGADLICNAVAVTQLLPAENAIVVDLGTASTVTAVNKDKEFIAGAIFPGLQTQVNSLAQSTEKLPHVEIVKVSQRPSMTIESIQYGIYYGTYGALKSLIHQLAKDCFQEEAYKVVCTGGFLRLFEKEELADLYVPDLVLKGLVHITELSAL